MSQPDVLSEFVSPVLLVVGAASPILLGLFFLTKRIASSWEDIWKAVAWFPFLGMLGLAIAMGLEKSNLWPIGLIVWGIGAFIALFVIYAMHSIVHSNQEKP